MKKAHKKEKKKKTSRKRSVGSEDEISGSSDNEGARKRKMKKHRTPSPEEQDLRDKIAQLTGEIAIACIGMFLMIKRRRTVST